MPTGFSLILPEFVAFAETCDLETDRPLHVDEADAVLGAAPKRVREFAAGRHCARRALGQLGIEAQALGRGKDRRPLWPPQVVGSITHCGGYCAAAVSLTACAVGIGIDAEENAPLPCGVLPRVAAPRERKRLERYCHDRMGAPNFDRMLFSAKESIFKAIYPFVRRIVEFEEVDVTFDVAAAAFTARLAPAIAGSVGTDRLVGRFAATSRFIFTALVVETARRARA